MESCEKQWEAILEKYLKYGSPEEVPSLREAYEVACEAHAAQRRKTGEPYIIHPLAVCDEVADFAMDAASLKAALLHDTVEDTEISQADIEKRFGNEVASLVDGLTKLEKISYSSREEQEMENLRKMFMAMARDVRVIIIKLCDRLHNIRTLEGMKEERRRTYALQTMEIYAPIAHRLGITALEHELEDRCLLVLDPVGYKEISEGLASRVGDNNFLEQTSARLTEMLREHGIPGRVSARVKSTYSLYRKVFVQNRSFDDVYDIYALRIIVDSQNDCYNVMGLVHAMYTPLPNRFKDYISTPKSNGYQSLHTSLMSREGVTFEVQIRTQEMHAVAEYGVAAHWKYKHGIGGGMSADDAKLAWIRQLMETQQEAEPDDFIHSIKVDLFDDEVFVLTPKSDVIVLPLGATPIDMAYAIHSAVGNRMIGAKVNRHIVPLDYQLKNGDVCEILTVSTPRGPSRDWLNLCKTSEARNKIRQWYKKERREDNILLGRDMLLGELEKNSLPSSVLTMSDIMDAAAQRLSYNTGEDLLAGIGYGGTTPQRACNRIREELEAQGSSPKEDAAEMTFHAKEPPSSGIEIQGIASCLVKFARCCTPVPGDKITGFVTIGSGVSIHRADCRHILATQEQETNAGRLVTPLWHVKPGATFPANICITGVDRFGLLADVASVIANMRISISDMKSRNAAAGCVSIFFTVHVADKSVLETLISRAHAVRGVVEVHRVMS